MSKLHRNIAVIILVDNDRRILLQHRAHDARIFPDRWGFFGGGIEEGETPEIAVKRETQEELGYSLKQPRLALTKELDNDINSATMHVYVESYDPQQKIVLGEGQDFGWFNLAEIAGPKFSPHVPGIIGEIKDRLVNL